jgi:hypothetical protein
MGQQRLIYMNITKVVYSPDRVIKVCVSKTSSEEQKQIVPALVRHAIVFFSIGLTNKPENVIEEAYKINKNKVTIEQNVIIVSFSLDELLQVEDCQITIDSLTIYLDSKKKIKSEFKKTFLLEEILTTDENLELPSPHHQQKNKVQNIKKGKENKSPNLTKHFKDSYEKFKDTIEQSKIGNLIKYKAKSFDHALKEFGISLLCRVLLSISHLNSLLENDFKEDLDTFLSTNVLNLEKERCEA